VVELAGGRGSEGGAHAASAAARLRELEAEHELELALAARTAAFEAQAREFKAGRCADLTLPSGVRLRADVQGDCASFPYPACRVRIHYEAFLVTPEGRPAPAAFDSSRTRGQAHDYQHGAGFAIAGLEEALGFFSKGARCRVRVPPDMAYKDAGFPPIVPPKTALLYDVELISFE
jgi:FKBP-type peptidyl-prolyl cis-trans isomerase